MSDHQPPIASPSPAGTVRRFRKKPVVIDAFQWNPVAKGVPGERHPAWDALDAWLVSLGYKTMDEADDDDDCPMWLNGDESITIPTLEGDMRCDIGDWIIRGVKGEFYPCKPDIFALTYEPAPSSASPTEGVPTRVTRFELIDHRERVGFHRRSFVANTCAIELSYQDGGRTLKVFVNDPAPASADARP